MSGETCEGCKEPCIMYEPKMRACEDKQREESIMPNKPTMKDKILHYFRDLNDVYNNCWKYDTLRAMLDAFEKEICANCINIEGGKPDETDYRK